MCTLRETFTSLRTPQSEENRRTRQFNITIVALIDDRFYFTFINLLPHFLRLLSSSGFTDENSKDCETRGYKSLDGG